MKGISQVVLSLAVLRAEVVISCERVKQSSRLINTRTAGEIKANATKIETRRLVTTIRYIIREESARRRGPINHTRKLNDRLHRHSSKNADCQSEMVTKRVTCPASETRRRHSLIVSVERTSRHSETGSSTASWPLWSVAHILPGPHGGHE